MGALTNKTPGTPDFTYLGLLHLEANTQITSLLQKIQDGGGNDTGLEVSTTALKYTGNLTLASLTASTLVYLDSAKKLVSLAAGSAGDVLTLAGGLPTWAAPATGITIDTTAITGGGTGRILFESGTNKVSESADLTYASGLLKIVGTSEQLRIGYDGSNYLKMTVSSTGLVTYDTVGSGAGHYFADKLLLGTTDNTDQSLLWINGAGGLRVGNTRLYDNNGNNALRGNTTAGGDNILFDSYGRICLRESSGRTIYYGTTYPPPASVGIGMASTTQGIGFPSMTGAQAEAITGLIDGIAIYCNNGNGTSITSTGFWGYGGGAWSKLN